MEDAGGQRRIGLAFSESVIEMLHRPGTSTGNDRNGHSLSYLGECLTGKALFHTVMVHTGKQYLPRTSVGHFACPVQESQLRALTPALNITVPAISIIARVYGADADLGTKFGSDVIYELGIADGCRVDTYLVCSC